VVNNKVAFAAVAVLPPSSLVSSLDAAYARLLAGTAVVLDAS
jgi:hypothetical protein